MSREKSALTNAVTLLKHLAHPIRLSILCNLMHNGEMNVGDIVKAEKGAASQSQISQFLAKMRQEGLVTCRKEGQAVFYTLACPHAQGVIDALYAIYCKK